MRAIITIVVIFFIIFLGVLIFGHRGKSPSTTPVKHLADYASTDVQMQLTTQGQINGDDVHREIVVTIGRTQRTISVIQGYQGNVLKSESLANNQNAYSAFLSSLDVAGYTKVHKSKYTTEAGQCPLGQRFIYEIINNGNDNMHTWSTSCGGSATFGGQTSTVQQLYQNQITNYDDFTADVNL